MNACATRGAVLFGARISDLPVIVHGPQSCGYIMSHVQNVQHVQDIIFGNNEKEFSNNVICTYMTDTDSVFGGREKLRETLESVVRRHDTIALVTTCVSGMIGDDVDAVAESVISEHPETRILTIHADGNLSGYGESGREQLMEKILDLINEDVVPDTFRMNLIGDSFAVLNRPRGFNTLHRLLELIGIPMGVRMFDGCNIREIRESKRNLLNVLVDDTESNRRLSADLSSNGFSIMDRALPKG